MRTDRGEKAEGRGVEGQAMLAKSRDCKPLLRKDRRIPKLTLQLQRGTEGRGATIGGTFIHLRRKARLKSAAEVTSAMVEGSGTATKSISP